MYFESSDDPEGFEHPHGIGVRALVAIPDLHPRFLTRVRCHLAGCFPPPCQRACSQQNSPIKRRYGKPVVMHHQRGSMYAKSCGSIRRPAITLGHERRALPLWHALPFDMPYTARARRLGRDVHGCGPCSGVGLDGGAHDMGGARAYSARVSTVDGRAAAPVRAGRGRREPRCVGRAAWHAVPAARHAVGCEWPMLRRGCVPAFRITTA